MAEKNIPLFELLVFMASHGYFSICMCQLKRKEKYGSISGPQTGEGMEVNGKE